MNSKWLLFILLLSLNLSSCNKSSKEKIFQPKEVVQQPDQSIHDNKLIKEPELVQNSQKGKTQKQGTTKQETWQGEVKAEKVVYPPKVKYISYSVQDSNKNGKIDTGEQIKLNVIIQNIGKGEGEELSVKADLDGKLIAGETEISIWPVKPNDKKQFSLNFWVPTTTPDTVPVHLTFSEGTRFDINLNIAKKPKTIHQQKIDNDKKRVVEKANKVFDELEKE